MTSYLSFSLKIRLAATGWKMKWKLPLRTGESGRDWRIGFGIGNINGRDKNQTPPHVIHRGCLKTGAESGVSVPTGGEPELPAAC